MADARELLARLDAYKAAGVIAHEQIFDLHVAVAARGRASARTRESLRLAARAATIDLPALVAPAERLRAQWIEQDLLDPAAAAGTVSLLDVELRRIEPELRAMMRRQRQIARELRDLAET